MKKRWYLMTVFGVPVSSGFSTYSDAQNSLLRMAELSLINTDYVYVGNENINPDFICD